MASGGVTLNLKLSVEEAKILSFFFESMQEKFVEMCDGGIEEHFGGLKENLFGLEKDMEHKKIASFDAENKVEISTLKNLDLRLSSVLYDAGDTGYGIDYYKEYKTKIEQELAQAKEAYKQAKEAYKQAEIEYIESEMKKLTRRLEDVNAN